MTENKLEISNKNGLATIGENYTANSGFLYNVGVRNFGSLKIIEEVAFGTAVSFLCGIKVFDQDGVLLVDKKMNNGFYYEKSIVVSILFCKPSSSRCTIQIGCKGRPQHYGYPRE